MKLIDVICLYVSRDLRDEEKHRVENENIQLCSKQ